MHLLRWFTKGCEIKWPLCRDLDAGCHFSVCNTVRDRVHRIGKYAYEIAKNFTFSISK